MKKTIAILLVLVIGMVGVWATEDSSQKITLSANISPVSAIKITKNELTGFVTDLSSLSAGTTEFAVTQKGDVGTIGYLSIVSNLRTGYKVEFTATPLTSVLVDGEDTVIVGSARYIDYKLTVGTDVDFDTAGASTTTDRTEITKMQSQTEPEYYSELINIVIADNFDTAVAGADYEGVVTFYFTAG